MQNQWIANRRKREFDKITEHLVNKFDLIRTTLSVWPGLYRLTIFQSTLHIGTIVRMNDSRWLLYSYQQNNRYVETDIGRYEDPGFYVNLADILKMSMMHAVTKKVA